MEHAEDPHLATRPVFVDDTGRRRTLTRRAGRVLVAGFAGYLGLLAIGVARDPRLGPLALPTIGRPAFHPAPAPAGLGGTTERTAAEATDAGADTAVLFATVQAGGVGLPSGGAVPGLPARGSAVPSGVQAPTTTTTRPTTTTSAPGRSGGGSQPTTTTTTMSSSTTTTTTTTGTPGQESGSATAKGPDGDGAPGQDRRATTNTTGPRR